MQSASANKKENNINQAEERKAQIKMKLNPKDQYKSKQSRQNNRPLKINQPLFPQSFHKVNFQLIDFRS